MQVQRLITFIYHAIVMRKTGQHHPHNGDSPLDPASELTTGNSPRNLNREVCGTSMYGL